MKMDSKKYFKIVLYINSVFIAAFGLSILSLFIDLLPNFNIVGYLIFIGYPVFLLFNIWGVVHALRRRPMDKYLKRGLIISTIVIILIISDIVSIGFLPGPVPQPA